MFNKKGMDGSYVAIGLFIGLILGIGLMYYLGTNTTMLSGLFCPTIVAP
ncbi:MAG: hypothetical protein NTY99_02315 [DPANN group archaeon]|nr:hypothetical protein [DPANN group archaeon]